MDSKQNRITLPNAFADVQLLASLLDEVEDGIYIVDCERRVQYWNHGAEEITGYLAQDVVGRHCHQDLLMHCAAEGSVLCGDKCPLLGVIEDGSRRECLVSLRHRHGHRIDVRVRARPIRNSQGTVVGALELFEKTVTPELTVPEVHCGALEPGCAANREYGEMQLRHALAAISPCGASVGWIAVELSQVNELEHRYGHGLIDAAMEVVAKTLQASIGVHDILTQWDDTRFRILVHSAGREQLAQLAEKLAAMVRLSNVEWWGDPLAVTAAVAAVMADTKDSLESLEERIRELLDKDEERGGDCAASQLKPDGINSLSPRL